MPPTIKMRQRLDKVFRVRRAKIVHGSDDRPDVEYDLTPDNWYLARTGGQLVVLRFDGFEGSKPLFVLADGEPNVIGYAEVLILSDLGSVEP